MRATSSIRLPDPDGVSAQIDLIGVPWLNIGFEPSAAPNGGSARAYLADSSRRQRPTIMGVHRTIASVARIFIQATLYRERSHMSRVVHSTLDHVGVEKDRRSRQSG